MTRIAAIADYTMDELLAAHDALKSEGGQVLEKMMLHGMNIFMTKLMNSEEDAERNRGRCDVYAGFVKLEGQVSQEIAARRKEKQ